MCKVWAESGIFHVKVKLFPLSVRLLSNCLHPCTLRAKVVDSSLLLPRKVVEPSNLDWLPLWSSGLNICKEISG